MRLKELRKEMELSQKKLADKVGTTQHHISRIESGKQNGSLQLLIKISNVLGVTVNELLGEEIK